MPFLWRQTLPDRYLEPIVNFLSNQSGNAVAVAELAEALNVSPGERGVFEQAVERLVEAGRVVWGSGRTIALPAMGAKVIGTFRQTSRGFGFVIPDEPNAHGDLFIPAGQNMDAVTGDFVVAKVFVREDARDERRSVSGRVVEILKRATNRAVGTLKQDHGRWIVVPDGNVFRAPIEVGDVSAKAAREGDKVVVELITFPGADQVATGVILEVLGASGEPDVELESVLWQFDLPREFPAEVLEQARRAATGFDVSAHRDREDLSGEVIITIDPDDARDFDDAISLKQLRGSERDDYEVPGAPGRGVAVWELGVHIADASQFVPVESAMDMEARTRGNSTYFPRHVIPMLPEVLSNGVCSLQEGQPRLTKTAFIRYDADGNVVSTRFANTVIRSKKRLTYKQAQAIIDDAKGEGPAFSKGLLEAPVNPNVPSVAAEIRKLLVNMDLLARTIRSRRLKQGMIVLELPEVDLVLDEEGHVIDAQPEDNAFTHTIIEMFMVEANEAVSQFLTKNKLAVLRRVHPDPDILTAEQVRQFVMIAGHKVPKVLDRMAIQSLLDSVRGTPIAYAVSLAVLKTFTTAEYSPQALGHYALASENYAHFTSPIRRYADLVIHRALDHVLRGGKGAPRRGGAKKGKVAAQEARAAQETGSGKAGGRKGEGLMPEKLGDVPDYSTLVQLGKHLSFTERRSSDAERELRAVKILQLLAEHVGDVIDGVVTGVTGFGVFVQSTRFLVEGMIRVADLPADFWMFDDRTGVLRGQRSGRRIALGDRARVQIVAVNISARQLELRLLEHGSAIGGETNMRTMEPRQQPKPFRPRDERGEGEGQPRRKNAAKRMSRREAARRGGQQRRQEDRNAPSAGGGGGKKGGGGRGRGRRGRRK